MTPTAASHYRYRYTEHDQRHATAARPDRLRVSANSISRSYTASATTLTFIYVPGCPWAWSVAIVHEPVAGRGDGRRRDQPRRQQTRRRHHSW